MGKSFFRFPLIYFTCILSPNIRMDYAMRHFLFGLCFVCVLNSSKIYTLYGKYLLNRSKFTTFAV